MQPQKIDTKITVETKTEGKPTNVFLLLIADHNNTTIVLQINHPDLNKNTYEDIPNIFYKLDRQTLDPP